MKQSATPTSPQPYANFWEWKSRLMCFFLVYQGRGFHLVSKSSNSTCPRLQKQENDNKTGDPLESATYSAQDLLSPLHVRAIRLLSILRVAYDVISSIHLLDILRITHDRSIGFRVFAGSQDRLL
jgi:hypothetical protein